MASSSSSSVGHGSRSTGTGSSKAGAPGQSAAVVYAAYLLRNYYRGRLSQMSAADDAPDFMHAAKGAGSSTATGSASGSGSVVHVKDIVKRLKRLRFSLTEPELAVLTRLIGFGQQAGGGGSSAQTIGVHQYRAWLLQQPDEFRRVRSVLMKHCTYETLGDAAIVSKLSLYDKARNDTVAVTQFVKALRGASEVFTESTAKTVASHCPTQVATHVA